MGLFLFQLIKAQLTRNLVADLQLSIIVFVVVFLLRFLLRPARAAHCC